MSLRNSLGLMVVGALLLSGCAPGGDALPGDPDDAENDNAGDPIPPSSEFDHWMADILQRPDDHEDQGATYSSDLIQAAYDHGDIDEQQYYLLCLQAAVDRGDLPDEYRAEPESGVDLTSLLRNIDVRFDAFPPEIQDQFRPYLLPLEDPGSVWYDPDEPTTAELLEGGGEARGATDMDRPLVGGDYFLITGPPETGPLQSIMESTLEYAYEKFADLGFNEPTDWIRVYLREEVTSAAEPDRDLYGLERFIDFAGQERCLLLIELDDDLGHMQAVAAHELFHCFQEYHEREVSEIDGAWIWESTATWAEEFVFPDINSEHERDAEAFAHLHEYLFETTATLEYASYLLWFFFYQRDGKTGTAVRDLFKEMYRVGERQALMDRPLWYTEFKDYALWNVNAEPYKYYADHDGLPSERPSGDAVVNDRIEDDDVFHEPVLVTEGGIKYFVFEVDDRIDRLHFDLGPFKKTESNHNGVQAIYRVGGVSHYEDVSYRDELVFCRNRESEAVTEIMLIISNSNLELAWPESFISDELVIDTTGECEAAWHGYVECTWHNSGEGEGDPDALLNPGNFETDGWARVDSQLVFDDLEHEFRAESETAGKNYRYQWYWLHDNWDDFVGGTLWEKRVKIHQGNRTYNWSEPECDSEPCDEEPHLPRVITLRFEEDRETYVLRDRRLRDVGTYRSAYFNFYAPGTLGMMQGHVAELRTDVREGSFSVTCPPDPLDLTLSADGLSLSGSATMGTVTVVAEYRYD